MRLRVTFSKNKPLIYTSHLDLARIWERSLRRAGAPLAYSQGFNPRPKLQLAAALPLGHVGEAEMLDVWLERPTLVEAFTKALVPVLPDGLRIREVRAVDPGEPALSVQIASAEYQVVVESSLPDLGTCIDEILSETELLQEWRGKLYDLRPLIERLWLEREGDGEAVLGMQLAARAGATARPEAVLEALGLGKAFARYHRRCLLTVAVN